MKSIVTNVLFALMIFVIKIDYGFSQKASSYSNQFQGPEQGYYYPQRQTAQNSEIHDQTPDDAFDKLFNHIRDEQKSKAANNFRGPDIIFPKPQHEETDGREFSYNDNDRYGPSKWKDLNAQCAGRNQSPIAINIIDATIKENFDPLVIDGFDITPESIEVENNGHSLKLVFKYRNDRKIRFSGGPLPNPFILDNVHFHWGSNSSGSEHVINDKRYAAEMHMVTYNSVYDSFDIAKTEPDGLAVLGILYNFDKYFVGKDNPWVRFIGKVIKAHSTYTESKWVFSLRELIKEADLRGLLSYKGSLTTPNCSENVLWMLSTRPISIKINELFELRKLRNAKGRRLLLNYRPLQDTNGRTVTAFKY